MRRVLSHGRSSGHFAALSTHAVMTTPALAGSPGAGCRPRAVEPQWRVAVDFEPSSRAGDAPDHGETHRRLWIDRRLRDRGAGEPRRLGRLAVLAAFRLWRGLRSSARQRGQWTLEHRPERSRSSGSPALSRRYVDPGDN